MFVQRSEIAQKLCGIEQLINKLSDQIVLIVLQPLSRNAPHISEALVPGEDSSVMRDDQNAVRRRVERRLQQSDGAPRFPLVAFSLAEIASDDHCSRDFTLTRHWRVGERELDRLPHLRSEDVLAIPQPAL